MTHPEITGIHEAAKLIPEPTPEEFEALKADIKTNGQRVAILVTPDGLLIDGRSRLRACKDLGIEPNVEVYGGDEALIMALVCSLNLKRRQLTPSQLTIIAVEILPQFEEKAKERQRQSEGRGRKGPQISADLLAKEEELAPHRMEAREEAAKTVGVNRDYVAIGKNLKSEAKDIYDEVKKGKLTIQQAKRQLNARRNEKRLGPLAEVLKEHRRRSPELMRQLVLDPLYSRKLGEIARQEGLPKWVTLANMVTSQLENLLTLLRLFNNSSDRQQISVELEEHASVRKLLLKKMEEVRATLDKVESVLRAKQ